MLTVICIGERDNLSRQIARHRGRIVARTIEHIPPNNAISLEITGYDRDKRELWEIPEVRRYIITFSEELTRRGVALERLLPQTRDVIRACYAAEAGDTVVTTGTQADTVRIGVEQVEEFVKNARGKMH